MNMPDNTAAARQPAPAAPKPRRQESDQRDGRKRSQRGVQARRELAYPEQSIRGRGCPKLQRRLFNVVQAV